MRTYGRFVGLALAFASLLCGTASPALAQNDSPRPVRVEMPDGWQAHNMKPLAYLRLDSESSRAFKMSMKRVGDSWYLLVADGGRAGGGFEVFDVTDPARPAHVVSVAVPGSNGQLTLGGDLLIVSQQAPFAPNSVHEQPYAGVPHQVRSLATFFDVSDPRHPKRLSSWESDGWGSHRNVYPGGRYAFMSAWVAGFKGQATLVVLDVSNPLKPVEVGHWWQPGQADGEPHRPPPNGYHGPASLSEDGMRLMTGYTPSLVNLDFSDPAHPRLIGKLDFSPLPNLGAQSLHSAIPLPGGMVHVNTEPAKPGCDKESRSFAAIVDNRDPAAPRLASFYPQPQAPEGTPSFCARPGRAGPHNVNGEIHSPDLRAPGPLIYMTYFNAGVRTYNVADPYDPREVGWFLPVIGPQSSGDRGLEDVIADTRGNIFVSDGNQKGVWVLRYSGPAPAGAEAQPR